MGLLHRLDEALFSLEMGVRLAAERLETGTTFNPSRKAMRDDPHPFYRALRQRDPFHRSRPGDGYVLTRYADCLAVLSDKTFSSDERHLRRWKRYMRRRRLGGIEDPYENDSATMLRMDPPDHTRLRNLVNKAFTPRAVERMRTRVASLVDELLRPVAAAGRTELVSDFAAPLPVVVIAEMLGVPASDRERFRHWSDEIVLTLGESTMDEERRADRAMEELGEYIAVVAEERRADPQEDLLSALVLAEEEGDRLTSRELLATLVLLLVAGNETTTKLIGNSVVALLRNPDQLELLRSEPKRIPGAVEELLRYDGPVQLTTRMVTSDRVLAGHRLERGMQLMLVLAAANRDPEQFADPERLDVTRDNVRHLALGHGIHHCLGAGLARLEAAIALEGIVTRFPDLRFADAPVQWGRNIVLRGPKVLPLSL